jgi:hypothetical protein
MQFSVRNSKLPLAVYREVAVHLSQVDGVATELVPQTSREFDYTLSQIGSLKIQVSGLANSDSHAQVERILAYYCDRFGAWERDQQAD